MSWWVQFSIAFAFGFIITSFALYWIGRFREAHDRILESQRRDKFYQRLEEQELGKAKEAWHRGNMKGYEFHRRAYNSLVAQHKDERNKVLKG